MAWNSPVGVPSRLWLYNSAAYLMFQKNMFIEQNPGDAALCWVHGPVLVARPSPRLLWSFPGGLTNCDSFFLKSDKLRLPSEPISFDFIIGLRCARRTKASAAPSIQLGILYFINYFHLSIFIHLEALNIWKGGAKSKPGHFPDCEASRSNCRSSWSGMIVCWEMNPCTTQSQML